MSAAVLPLSAFGKEFLEQAQADFLRSISIFCIEHGGDLYADWSGEKVFKFLAFHWLQGGLFVAREGVEIRAVMVAWRDATEEIFRREREDEPHFEWKEPPAAGDAILMGAVIARDKDSILRLVQLASARWPDWKMRRLFTYRRGELHELAPAAIERLARGKYS